MIPRLYEKNETLFTSFGICSLPDAIECLVTETRNEEFYLNMTYPCTGKWVDEIIVDRIILADPYDGATEAEPFRISSIEYDMNDNMLIYAEHISYQLNYIIAGQFFIPQQHTALEWWNVMMSSIKSPSCPFTFESTVSSSVDLAFGFDMPIPMRTALGGTENSLLDLLGGELAWNRWKIIHSAARGSNNGVKIAYTKNLTGLTYSIDMSNVYTGAIAYYFDGDVDYGEGDMQHITSPYAFERDIVLDASSDLSDQSPTKAQLNAYARDYLNRNAEPPAVSVTVEFVPLWQTDEYKNFYDLEHVSLCDTVEIIYPPLNLKLEAKVVQTIYDVLADRYSEITIDTVRPNISDTILTMMKKEGM